MEENQNYYYQAPPEQAPPTPPDNSFLEYRNIATCIILSVVTCGIYGLYWLYKLVGDLNRASNDPDQTSGGMVILLSFITCGIYQLYWFYKAGQQMNTAKLLRGMQQDASTGILYLVLAIFQLHIISYALIQNELNIIATTDRRK